ncbi:unnamed protein product [Rhizoctonia solani]|uniref:Uncharacterized protein n=1 Tax=Rhizoctonia solani TaxID=456999 RepID=A0A8H3HQ11_9AGAM|nr:unnamed protein product [Rhizoctonia solani]
MSTVPPRRLLDVFPPGFDSKSSSSRIHYSFAPDQLYNTLTSSYNPEKHVEWTLVKSVWYGKQLKAVQHEFILIEVQDTKALLKNYMVLDRNVGEDPSSSSIRKPFRGRKRTTSSSCRGPAMDAFRVSYNGLENQLLQECQLLPRQYLEKIEFNHDNPLYLYQLVTLVHVVSERSPQYALAYRNCYWFAGLIWECLRSLRPDAQYNGRLAEKRGRIAMLRYTPEERDKKEICKAFEEEIQRVEASLSNSRKLWRAFAQNLRSGALDNLPDLEGGGSHGGPRDVDIQGIPTYSEDENLTRTRTSDITPNLEHRGFIRGITEQQ